MTQIHGNSTGTVALDVDCAIPGEAPQPSVNYITVAAPATIAVGEPAELTVTLQSKAATPRDLARYEVTAELQLIADGAEGRTTLIVKGLTNPEPIPRGERVFLDSGTVGFVPASSGVYSFTPGDHVVVTSDHPVECIVTGGSAVAARTEAK